MPTTRIVLHIGAAKTGTSALQTGLVRNRQALAGRGIFYPESTTDQAASVGIGTSGNGMGLALFLNPRLNLPVEPWQARTLAEMIASAQGADCRTLLISSEYLGFFTTERMTEFLGQAAEAEASVEIVYFVRHIAGHAMSAYSQSVKRNRFNESFGAFLEKGYQPSFEQTIKRCLKAVGRDRLSVLLYDDARMSILRTFADALGCETSGFTEVTDRVNRSLTPTEIRALRFVNRYVKNEAMSAALSESLVRAYPARQDSGSMSPEEYAVLARRWQGEVDKTNRLIGREILKLTGDDVRVLDTADAVSELEETFVHLLEFMIDDLSSKLAHAERSGKDLSEQQGRDLAASRTAWEAERRELQIASAASRSAWEAERRELQIASEGYLARIDAQSKKPLIRRLFGSPGNRRRLNGQAKGRVASIKLNQAAGVEGFLDRFGPSRMHGWAYRPDRPSEPLRIAFYDGERFLCTAVADRARADVAQNGKMTDRCGFDLPIPQQLLDGKVHSVDIRLAGTALSLLPHPFLIKLDAQRPEG